MNRDALSWCDVALRLEAENCELRRIATVLLFWIAEHEDLLAFAKAEIEKKCPEERRAA
jgi:hypothetical protein